MKIIEKKISRISLYKDNPRHEKKENEKDVIEYLVEEEDIYNLARDIHKHGLNPLELFAIFPSENNANSFYAAEGNRRICALKLMLDPAKAPVKYKNRFEKLSKSWEPITSIQCVLFNNFDETRIWLERIHGDEKGGIGRKKWNADQKARFFPENKNKVALLLLDYLQDEGFITKDERENILTTITRFIDNEKFREALGVDTNDDQTEILISDKELFVLRFKKFIDDINKKNKFENAEIGSRFNKDKIGDYAKSLTSIISPKKVAATPKSIPLSGSISPTKKPKIKPRAPKSPLKPKHISAHNDIEKNLEILDNYKLQNLYYSICKIDLEDHTPLLYVGAWCFLEVLTVQDGNNGNDFQSYLKNDRLAKLGVAKDEMVSIRSALERISSGGNTTKHKAVAANFNSEQLYNDFEALSPMINNLILSAISKKT